MATLNSNSVTNINNKIDGINEDSIFPVDDDFDGFLNVNVDEIVCTSNNVINKFETLCNCLDVENFDKDCRYQGCENSVVDEPFSDFDLIDPNLNLFNSFLKPSLLLTPNKLSLLNFKNCFTLMHINCQSLINKLSQFNLFLNSCQVPFSVIGLSETWLNESNASLINIPNFQFIYSNRADKIGGGVGLLIRENLNFFTRDDLLIDNDGCDFLAIEIIVSGGRNIVVCVLYRPPNTNAINFITDLSNTIKSLYSLNKLVYIMGDFNIDLLKKDTHNISENFINMLYSLNFFPLINLPTRVTETSSTLIDNIFTNHLIEHSSAVISSDLSDHYPIFTIIHKHNSVLFNSKSYTQPPNLSINNLSSLNEFFVNYDWRVITSSTDINKSFPLFLKIIHSNIVAFCPSHKPKSQKIKQNWMTQGLVISSHKKNKLFSVYKKNPTPHNKSIYINYKNTFIKLCRNAEKKYYINQFLLNKNNIKHTWSLIKECFGQQKTPPPSILSQDDGKLVTDERNISNILNNYFNSAANFDSKLSSHMGNSYADYLNNSPSNSFFLVETSENEVLSTVLNLKTTHSAGDDNISSFLLSKIIYSIIQPLTYLIKLSLNTGKFPDCLKTSKIIPLYKSGSKCVVSNYRPISLVSTFSKILEKIVHKQISSFFDKNNLLHDSQYGFKKNSSTELAILDIYSYISENIDAKLFTAGVFIDLSKAFDSLDHNILLDKLNHYGIRGKSLDWFSSYLEERHHYVQIVDIKSDIRKVERGVPQGSILGPLLFNIFINDVCNCSDVLKMVLFADDTTVLYSDPDAYKLANIMSCELEKFYTWTKCNKLEINCNKTCTILFGPKIKTNLVTFEIYINNNLIKNVTSTKFLGLIITSNLSWLNHISYVSKKISKNIGIIYRLKNNFPDYVLRQLYFSLIYPYLIYCVSIWGNSPHSHLKLIKTCQNNYLRILSKINKFDHISEFYKKSNILEFDHIYIYNILILAYKLWILKFNKHFYNRLFLHNSTISLNLRNLPIFTIPKFRTKIFCNSSLSIIMRLWNYLPTSMREINSLYKFKKSVKPIICNNFFRLKM